MSFKVVWLQVFVLLFVGGTCTGAEMFPNGNRINMGCYGGTGLASRSYFPEDLNGDGVVNMKDFGRLAGKWLMEK